ncbi:MAG TPA: hypothetical protein VJ695_07450 [Nitrososphaera sp.]|nr:hypothetical protein [Nitrososphaera sp.]
MKKPLPLLTSPTISRTVTTAIIAAILVATNFTAIDAQSTSVTMTTPGSQQAPTQNAITTSPSTAAAASTFFQSINDSFSIRIPQGWQIQDLNNSGSTFSEESIGGYGILARLCPEEQVQQRPPLTLTNANSTAGCSGAQQEVIHIVRYPNLDSKIQTANNATSAAIGASFNSNNNQTTTVGATTAATTTIDNILAYHLQKLQEVGYNSIQLVNNQDTRVNLTMAQANQTVTTLPAKYGEIVYTTASAPGEIKRAHFILAATNATAPSLGITKGYTLFYEGHALAPTATSSGLSSLPPTIAQAFNSFELIVAPELEQALTPQPTTVGQPAAGENNPCDPSYPNNCIPPPPPQLNCDSPSVPTNFRVAGSDPHGFDADNDGIGCETAASSTGSGTSVDSGGEVGEDDEGDDSCHPSYPDLCIPPPPPDFAMILMIPTLRSWVQIPTDLMRIMMV